MPTLLLLLLLATITRAEPLRVMTFNTHGANVTAFLQKSDCDVILLQEAAPLELEGYQQVRADKLVVLTRKPIQSSRRIKGLCERRDGLEVQIPGLRIIGVHFVTADPNQSLAGAKDKKAYLKRALEIRRQQTGRVARLLDGSPTVVGGDFNTTILGLPGMRDAGHGLGGTFGALPIDKLFTNVPVVEARVLECDLSDHRPLQATLDLDAGKRTSPPDLRRAPPP